MVNNKAPFINLPGDNNNWGFWKPAISHFIRTHAPLPSFFGTTCKISKTHNFSGPPTQKVLFRGPETDFVFVQWQRPLDSISPENSKQRQQQQQQQPTTTTTTNNNNNNNHNNNNNNNHNHNHNHKHKHNHNHKAQAQPQRHNTTTPQHHNTTTPQHHNTTTPQPQPQQPQQPQPPPQPGILSTAQGCPSTVAVTPPSLEGIEVSRAHQVSAAEEWQGPIAKEHSTSGKAVVATGS